MPITPNFYSAQEVSKPADKRVHHNNSACAAGQDVRAADKRYGTGGYRLCGDCASLNARGK